MFSVQAPFKNAILLHQKYVVEGLNPREIANQFFSSRSTIIKYLKHFDIPLRSLDERLKRRKSQLGYGEKQTRDGVTANERELKNIALMQKLRGEELSYWKIAAHLNDLGILSKTGRRWTAKTIHQVLKRVERAFETVESRQVHTDSGLSRVP